MPVAHRFAFVRETVRSHPVIVATTAATGGVLLGAFVAFQVVAPPRLQTSSVQVAADMKPAVKAAAETTTPTTSGSASTADSVASAECDQQTWPNLSRVCMDQMRDKTRAARVITADKPAVAAIEPSPPAPAAESKPAASAPAVASVVPPDMAPVVSPPAPATDPAPPVALAVATPEPAPTADVAPQTPAQAAVKALKAERALQKNKTKIKGEPKAVVRRDFHENDDGSAASYADEDRDVDDVRPVRRFDRSRRIVERGAERDDDVRSADGDGDRRIIVIRRGRGGGLFENLFGIGRDDD